MKRAGPGVITVSSEKSSEILLTTNTGRISNPQHRNLILKSVLHLCAFKPEQFTDPIQVQYRALEPCTAVHAEAYSTVIRLITFYCQEYARSPYAAKKFHRHRIPRMHTSKTCASQPVNPFDESKSPSLSPRNRAQRLPLKCIHTLSITNTLLILHIAS